MPVLSAARLSSVRCSSSLNDCELVKIAPMLPLPASMNAWIATSLSSSCRLGDLRLLLGDGLLGGGDVFLELAQLVHRDDIVLGEDVGLALERLELIGELLDSRPLVVDRVGGDVLGGEERDHDDGCAGHRNARHPEAKRLHDAPQHSRILRTRCKHVAV